MWYGAAKPAHVIETAYRQVEVGIGTGVVKHAKVVRQASAIAPGCRFQLGQSNGACAVRLQVIAFYVVQVCRPRRPAHAPVRQHFALLQRVGQLACLRQQRNGRHDQAWIDRDAAFEVR